MAETSPYISDADLAEIVRKQASIFSAKSCVRYDDCLAWAWAAAGEALERYSPAKITKNGVAAYLARSIIFQLHKDSRRYAKPVAYPVNHKQDSPDEYLNIAAMSEYLAAPEAAEDSSGGKDYAALYAALDELPASQREVVVESYLRGFTNTVLAEELNATKKEIDNRRQGGIGRLRTMLRGEKTHRGWQAYRA